MAAVLAALIAAGGVVALRSATDAPETGGDAARVGAATAYAKLPLRFEQNSGQTAKEVRYVSRGAGYALFLTPKEAVLSLMPGARASSASAVAPRVEPKSGGAVLRMRLVGSNPNARVEGVGRLPGTSNYLRGDRSRWRTGVPGFARVRYSAAYPGIDLVYHGSQGRLEYDFVVAPGADPGRIALNFRGAERLRLDRAGNLIATTRAGDVRQTRPVLYQRVGGKRRSVAGRYVLEGRRVGFEVGRYDRSRPLVIDPVLAYATYLGGAGLERLKDIAVGSEGSAYVTGETSSDTFPTTAGAYDLQRTGRDAFITKLNPQGSALVYSTFLGGDGGDSGEGIDVDSGGRAYVAGRTSDTSTNFPTTAGAFDTTLPGGGDAFLTVLNAQGSGLAYSTFLGGSTPFDPDQPDFAAADQGNEVAVDGAGVAYVSGQACATNFPTKAPAPGPYDASHNGDCEAFVSKLNPAASGAASLVASTYLGGDSFDGAIGIALGSSGPYVAGTTGSTNFPTAGSPAQGSAGGLADVFVATLNTNLSSVPYSTYLGGSEFDSATGVDVDASGDAYVTGQTSSPDFPTESAMQAAHGGGDDIFVAKLAPGPAGLSYSTYLGAAGLDLGGEIAVDSAGGAYVGGYSDSDNFASLNPVSPRGRGTDPLLLRLKPDGSGLSFGTYLGGGADEAVVTDDFVSVALGAAGTTFVAGNTDSTDFPTQAPLQAQNAGRGLPDRHDGFVARIGPDVAGAPLVTGISPRSGPPGTSVVIRGGGFGGASSVRFGGTATSRFTVNSPTQITAVSPPRAEGDAAVTVATPAGTSPPNPVARFQYAEGHWTPTGSLPGGPSSQAVRLGNGKVLAVGGPSQTPDSAKLYDPATGIWTPTGALNVPRSGHTATLLGDGRVLVLGGSDPDFNRLTSAEIYNPVTGNWTQAGDLAVAREHHTATLLRNGKVLVVAGEDETFSARSDAELYDPATGDSTPAGELALARADHSANLLGGPACSGGSAVSYCGRVLVAGGRTTDISGEEVIATAELYNPATNSWSPAGSLGAARVRHTATSLQDGRVLAVGGRQGSLSLQSAELYSPAANAWTPTTGLMRLRRDSHAAVLLSSGKVLLAGGFDGLSGWNNADLFNPVSGRFNSAGLMGSYRSGIDNEPFGVLLANGKALVGGGGGATTSELYTPSTPVRPPVGGGGPGADRAAPVVSRFRLTRRRFRVARRATPRVAQRRRTRAGSALVYRLSEAARVRIVIQRRLPGRRVDGRCRKATRARRNRRRCIRYVSVGTLRRSGRSGPNRHSFTGRIARRKLRPGRYRAVLRASDAANNRSRASRAGFRVVRR